ncbi:MAG: fused MFS/spermidine synthase [Verrucomicrobiae bacterium]|nr:fused MFS/spermidine synthase [Verrucomicrobiae bacterium]
MKLSARWIYPTAFICLLLSGAAALVYQVAWARYLSLLLGHTSYAVVAVLVAFMGGLALGNWWFGRFADRTTRPLAVYGWLEVGIALYALFFPVYYELCQRGYVALGSGVAPGSQWLLVLKFLFSFAAILLPATLMGGTLPVLTKLVTRSLGELRERVAGLYFINSLGAVAGILIADFWWIPSMGLDATVFGGAVINGVVAAVALVVSAGLQEGREVRTAGKVAADEQAKEPAEGPAPGDATAEEVYSPWELRLAIVAAGLSGFVAMLYEVVWTRVLALALGSSTHAFSIMLVTFITGIASGAWVIGRWRRLRRVFDAFGWAELALAVTLFVSMFFYHLLPYWFVRLGTVVAREPANHLVYQGLQLLVCFAVMFVPSLCLGMTLPLASRVATSELARTGRSVGLVFSVNTLGTVLGAALTGLVFLPMLGLAKAFALGVGLNLVIALAVLLRRNVAMRSAVVWGSPVLVVGLIGLAHVALSPTWDRALSLGLWRLGTPPRTLAEYRQMINEVIVFYHRDGPGSTVLVHGWTNRVTGVVDLTLRVNGKADATSRGDLPTQLLAGHIPMLLKPDIKEAMVVGIGSGMTCGAILTHPGVERLDAVEISADVYIAARDHFAPFNDRALEDPRVEVILDDAKSFLRTSGRKYDLIVSEPSNPWMAGVSGVFSVEYYEACLASLKPGGVLVQWVQIYETSEEAVNTVLATVRSVFPFFSLWQTLPGDLLLVASAEPLRYDLEATQQRFDEPAVTADLRRADIFQLSVLLGLQFVSESNAPFLAPEDAIAHSDFYPRLEYLAERAFFVRAFSRLVDDYNEATSTRPRLLVGRHLEENPLTVTDAQSFALFHTSHQLPPPRIMRSITERWRELDPSSLLAVEFSGKLDQPLPVSELEALRMRKVRDELFERAATEPEPLRIYSRHLMHAYRALRSAFYQPPTEELIEVLDRLVETDPAHLQSHLLRLAEIAWDVGDEATFVQLAADSFLQSAGAPAVGRYELDFQAPGRVLYLLIDLLWHANRFEDAYGWCRAAREGRFLERGSRFYNPMLAVVVRKVEATLASAAEAAGVGP